MKTIAKTPCHRLKNEASIFNTCSFFILSLIGLQVLSLCTVDWFLPFGQSSDWG